MTGERTTKYSVCTCGRVIVRDFPEGRWVHIPGQPMPEMVMAHSRPTPVLLKLKQVVR